MEIYIFHSEKKFFFVTEQLKSFAQSISRNMKVQIVGQQRLRFY